MAKLIKRGKHLDKELNKEIRKDNYYSIVHFALLGFSLYALFAWANVLFFIIWVGYRIFVGKKWKELERKRRIVSAGIRGEKNTEDVLLKLPDSYHIFADLVIVDGDKESQIDHVVVGPTGVFVIETKNWSGTVYIDSSTPKRVIHAKPSGNSSHYNPSNQVATHVYRLSSVIKKKSQSTWVSGCVFFPHPDVFIEDNDDKYPWFDDGNTLIQHILSSDKVNLPLEQIKAISALIKKEMK